MKPINLQIISLPVHFKAGSKGSALKSEKGNGDLFSTILKSMNSAQEKSFYTPSGTARAGLNKGDFYLESLRKALLGKGKPLNKISLNSNDFPLLKRLLYQSGFSKQDAENLLKGLLQNNSSGKINLSQFFNQITELAQPKKKIYQPIILEPAAIPYLESALRNLGLKPKEVEHVLSSARVEGGGFDLNKFVINLKGISNKGMPLQNKAKLDQFVKAIEEVVGRSAEFKDLTPENEVKPVHNLLASQISKNLEGTGIQIPDEGNGGRQITEKAAKQSQLPNDVKATIDRILEKVVITNEKNGRQSPLFSFSKSELNDLHSKEKLSKKGKGLTKDNVLFPSKEKEGISSGNGQRKAEASFSSKEFKLFSDLNVGRGFNREIIEEGSAVKPETRMMDIPQNISGSTLSESISTDKQNAEPVRSFLPGYLIDQVGKQISRSILRGERVIRLQLKPPELGTLRVEMDMKDNVLKLGMIAETNSAKELLLASVHELREALLEQGVKLDRLDVQINHNFNQSLANSKDGLNGRQGQGRDWMPFMADSDTEDPALDFRNMPGDRLLDLLA